MLFRYVVVVSGELLKKPHSQTVYEGEEISLHCLSNEDEPPDWFFKSATSTGEPEHISGFGFVRDDLLDKYKLADFVYRPGHLMQGTEYNLVILNVKLSDAGEYTCSESSEDGDRQNATAILTVQRKSKGNDMQCDRDITCSSSGCKQSLCFHIHAPIVQPFLETIDR